MILRPTVCKINLKNLDANYGFLRKISPVIAVVKADAYGHGAVEVSKTLQRRNIKMFAVALIEEGIVLRKQGIKKPILIGGSIYPFGNFREVIKYNLTPTIASVASAEALSGIARRPVLVHVKVDCGMNRIGLKIRNAYAGILAISNMKNILIGGVYTHFPSADCDIPLTAKQAGEFIELKKKLEAPGICFHASNTAALRLPHPAFDMIRPGLGIYGLKPYPGFRGIKPVMSVHTKIVFLKKIKKGEKVSYGGSWSAKKQTTLATLPIGYADGIRRELSNRGSVIIRGRRFPIAGRVCMDMLMVDVTDLKRPKIGEDAVLMGREGREQISAEEIAGICGTINYEITCGISARVPRVCVR
ncbi:MAG: alanine racemase [bacterium]